MIFKKAEIKDKSLLEGFVSNIGDDNCETDFINLLLWQNLYNACFCALDDTLIIKTEFNGEELFLFPFGNYKKGMEAILEYTSGRYPVFRAQQGKRFEDFKTVLGDRYEIKEQSGGVDYIYLREDLSGLSGKKYHSKRNHISAFSKQFDWSYEPIGESNLADVKECANKWYKENADRFTKEMETEQSGVFMLIDNFKTLGILGGAIRVEGHIVAFTFASFINGETVDIHIEKALSDYAVAYTVINNQFAKRLPESVKYINREDDLGLEGLKKSKLSYHPAILLKKYICLPKEI